MNKKQKKFLHLFFFLSILAVALYASFLLSQYITSDKGSQQLIQEFGHLSIIIISFIAGLNAAVPIPAATFVPVFTAGGISLPVIIALLVIGTMAANLLSYVIGRYGGNITRTHYPQIQKKLVQIYQEKRQWLFYFVFLFTALVPFPDEIFIIPLGLVGVKLKDFFIPLFLGTICYQAMLAFGIHNIFKYLIG